MKNMSFGIILLFVFQACHYQEKITPIATPITLADLQKEQIIRELEQQGHAPLTSSTISEFEQDEAGVYYLKVKYNVKDIDVFQELEIPNKFEELANSFLGVLVRIVFKVVGPLDIDLDKYIVDLSSLSFNRNIIRSIEVKKLYIVFSEEVDQQNDFRGSFSYVENLDLAVQKNVPGFGVIDDLLFSYEKSNNRCFDKCMVFDIHKKNILEIIGDKKELSIKPFLSISDLPDINDLVVSGQVTLRIGLKLPF